MSFTTFLSEESLHKQKVFYDSFEDIYFSLALLLSLSHDEVTHSLVTSEIEKIRNNSKLSKSIILSQDFVNSSIYSKVLEKQKNILFSFKIVFLSQDFSHKQQQEKSLKSFEYILNSINKKHFRIIHRLNEKIINYFNESYMNKNLHIKSVLYINDNHLYAHSLLNIQFLSENGKIVDSFDVLIRKQDYIIQESVFHFLFDISKHFDLPLTKDITEQRLPTSYKDLQNFVITYANYLFDQHHIVYYIKKYLEEKEKHYFLNQKKGFYSKIHKEKNELEICMNMYQEFKQQFIHHYRSVIDKTQIHFLNSFNKLFNILCVDFFKKYFFDNQYINVYLLKDKTYEFTNDDLDFIKNNSLFQFDFEKDVLVFKDILHQSKNLMFTISPVFRFDLNNYKSYKYIHIKII